jgi:hypothetical protein
MAKVKSTRKCTHPGCRKFQAPGETTCKSHTGANGAGIDPPVTHAIDHVVRMSELESYKLAALDSELRNHLLSVQNYDLKIVKLASEFEVSKRAIQEERKQSISAFEIQNKAYQTFIAGLAEKYGLDPYKMSFDTESQILRDLRGEAEDKKPEG